LNHCFLSYVTKTFQHTNMRILKTSLYVYLMGLVCLDFFMIANLILGAVIP
jgi:hypothetical protein